MKFSVFLFFAILWAYPLRADVVKEVHPEGMLVLENGEKVHLAGLRVSPEAQSFLAVLLSDQAFSMKRAPNPQGEIPAPVYLELKARELTLPLEPDAVPQHRSLEVHELLVQAGLAEVDPDTVFENKEKLLKIQAKAKEQGKGIWSFGLTDRLIYGE